MAWLPGWAKRVKITIDADDIDATLTWFPLTVVLGTSVGKNNEDVSFIFDELTSDTNRFKIAATQSDGITQLYVEIDKWDDANETAVLHVSKTGWEISDSSDTDIYLYYDSTHADNIVYVSDANDPHEGIGSATYDAFGILVKTAADEIIYFYRQGTSHAADQGDIYKCVYTPSTKSWGTPAQIYTDSVNSYDCRNVGGGMIGTDIYVFFGMYQYGTSTWKDIGFIKSTDGGDNWGSFVSLASQVDESAYSPFGALIATGTSGKYLQTWYDLTPATNYRIKAFVTDDSGADAFDSSVTIYSGATHYVEASAAYIGSNELICLMRNDSGGYVAQTMSEDDGATWGTDVDHDDGAVDATNLGDASGVKVPFVYYDSGTDKCVAMYQERATPRCMKVSITDASTVFADATAWATPKQLGLMNASSCGYPYIVEMNSGEYFYVYCDGSTSDHDTWCGYLSEACGAVWDTNYKGVYHLSDATASTTYDSTLTGNHLAKASANAPAEDTSNGKLGDCQDFDGTDDYCARSSPSFIDDSQGTVELWVKFDDNTHSYIPLAASVNGATDDEYFFMYYRGDLNDLIAIVLLVNGSISWYGFTDNNAITDTNWHHWVVKSNASEVEAWLDGTQKTITDSGSYGPNSGQWLDDATQANVFSIGALLRATPSLDTAGLIDEVRYASTARADQWITASYESQNDALIDWGSEETASIELSITEGLQMSDTTIESMTAGVSIIEGFKGSDTSGSGGSTAPVAVTEGGVFSETPSAEMGAEVSVSEGLTASDAASVIMSTMQVVLTEGVDLSDTPSLIAMLEVTDSVTLSDLTAGELLTGVIYLMVQEGLKVSDAPSIAASAMQVSVTDGIVFSDLTTSVLAYATLYLSITEGFTVSDTTSLAASAMQVSISDIVQLSDSASVILGEILGYLVHMSLFTKTYHDVKIWTGERDMVRRDWQREETVPVWATVYLESTDALYDPDQGVTLTVTNPSSTAVVDAQAMTRVSTGLYVYYWNSESDSVLGWYRAKATATDGTGATAKATIEHGGFNLEA